MNIRWYEAMTVSDVYRPPLFSIAPMMGWTDNHYRTLARLISKHAWLYTEMLAAETIVYQEENLDSFLAYSPDQHPIVLQIGGRNLENLAKATRLANAYGYDEINFNCGCPSPKVSGRGCFGAVHMLNPKFVGEAMSVIAANTDAPVTVKCRIGVDDHDSYSNFIHIVSSTSPTKHFIIHSRKALLSGLSPADNRRIPPLKCVPAYICIALTQLVSKESLAFSSALLLVKCRYEYFFALLRDFPDLKFTINGGINSVLEADAALRSGAHGVMLGRAAYYNYFMEFLCWLCNSPWHLLGHVDTLIYGSPSSGITRRQVLEKYQVYGESVLGKYGKGRPNLRDIVRPLINLFHSELGNGQWKRRTDAALLHCTTMKTFLDEVLPAIPDFVLDSSAVKEATGREDLFADVRRLLPPPYEREPHSSKELKSLPEKPTILDEE
ncbi:unnamed protein product [Thlaspi arvense]|uniref:DUS-like FMN-binding domain-containing protein n=1 Tax=Thlaspi arvense TaxID=13288 RepID=A0AAU9RQH4_THLAR|nr:unnamed protein product [Thlaspi arvense]